MTNKELRAEIYKWLNVSFGFTFKQIKKEQRKELEKILEEFNPTQEVKKVVPKEYIKTTGKVKVWRSF